MHPEEDYWRINASINKDISDEKRRQIIREERELLLKFEVEEVERQ